MTLPRAAGALLLGLVLGGLLGLLLTYLPGANDPLSVTYPVAGAVMGLPVGILFAAIPSGRRSSPGNPIRQRSRFLLLSLMMGGAIGGFFLSLSLVFFVVLSCTAGAYTTTEGMALICFALAAGVGTGLVWGYQGWARLRAEGIAPSEAIDRGERGQGPFVGLLGVAATTLGFGLFLTLKPEPRPVAVFTLEEGRVEKVAFSPDGRTLAAASSELGSVMLWDIVTRQAQVIHEAEMDSSRDTRVAFGMDGHRLVTMSGGKLDIWELPRGTLKASHDFKVSVLAMAVSGDGQRWAVLDTEKTLFIGETATGKQTGRVFLSVPQSMDLSGRIALSPDGTVVAVCRRSRFEESFDEVHLLTVPRGARITVLRGPGHMASSLAFSPDGSLLATAGNRQLVRLWDARTGELRHTFDGDVGPTSALAFSPDGKLLAVGGGDYRSLFAPADARGMVAFWDVSTRRRLRTFKAHRSTIKSLAFAPDSKHLAVACGLSDVTLWEVADMIGARP